MKIKFKKLREDAVIPTRATDGSAGFDLTATSKVVKGTQVIYTTDLAVEIPKGYVGLLFPRSSITNGVGLRLGNSVGVLDSDFRGEVQFKFDRQFFFTSLKALVKHFFTKIVVLDSLPLEKEYMEGDRIGQLVVVPCLTEAEEVSELSETVRGSGGFGSSDPVAKTLPPDQLKQYMDTLKPITGK